MKNAQKSVTQHIGEKEYRDDIRINNSGLRTYQTCPNLYNEQYNTKTYVEPDKDYFLYGQLTECILTEPEKLAERYVRVDKKVNAEDALQYEANIRKLEEEMEAQDDKGESMSMKAGRGHKTAQKGIESRCVKIEEYQNKLRIIRELGTREQVTNGMWEDAEATAFAMRENAFFKTLMLNEITLQRVFFSKGRKGKLDYVDFSPPVQKIFAMWVAGLTTQEAMKESIAGLDERSKYGRIVDFKTTKSINDFEPGEKYNVQLGLYQDLVLDVTGIKCRCYILAGDKDPTRKFAQAYEIAQPLLDAGMEDFRSIEKAFRFDVEKKEWPSAKQLWGKDQKCYRCSICSVSPLSMDGEPLLVEGKLFPWVPKS